MSDENDPTTGAVIPSPAGKVSVRDSLVRRGLRLLDESSRTVSGPAPAPPEAVVSTRPVNLLEVLRQLTGWISPPIDDDELRRLHEQANAGVAAAQYDLGWRYAGGHGVPQDGDEGARWTRKAAEQGHADAQCKLGDSYFEGRGVPKDDGEAVHWYGKAAKQGHTVAIARLVEVSALRNVSAAQRRRSEQLVEQRLEAVRQAAEQGHAEAQYDLGAMYFQGWGVPKDDGEAVHWWLRAAGQGHVGAQECVASHYQTGQGVPRDLAQAIHWYRRMADHGVDTLGTIDGLLRLMAKERRDAE